MTTTSTTPATPAIPSAYATAGKVKEVRGDSLVFLPSGTNYELHLVCPGYAGAVNRPVRGIIRVKARKVWTVPSGGNFLTPIFGPPKIIQGRVKFVSAGWLAIQGGATVIAELPDNDKVYDLANGPIAAGEMVNVTAFAGASFEFVG